MTDSDLEIERRIKARDREMLRISRALDAKVAEHVMEYDDVHIARPNSWVGIASFMTMEEPSEWYCLQPAWIGADEIGMVNLPVPLFSTTWSGVGEMVDHMLAEGFSFHVHGPWRGRYGASFEKDGGLSGEGMARSGSLFRAVCLAALRACDAEVEPLEGEE